MAEKAEGLVTVNVNGILEASETATTTILVNNLANDRLALPLILPLLMSVSNCTK